MDVKQYMRRPRYEFSVKRNIWAFVKVELKQGGAYA